MRRWKAGREGTLAPECSTSALSGTSWSHQKMLGGDGDRVNEKDRSGATWPLSAELEAGLTLTGTRLKSA